MADRPGDGPPDGPDYGWLYGGQQPPHPPPTPTQPVRRQPRPEGQPDPRPEATRAIPVQPRPTPARTPTAPPSRPVPPVLAPTPREDGPAGGGGATTYGRSRRGFRPGVPRLRWLLLLIPAWIAYLVAVPVLSWQSVDKVDFEPSGTRPDDQPGTTYLLVGSDSRAGLSRKERRELGTGNAGGQRTDTILLLHTGSGPNLLLSVPRDTLVDIPGHGTTKINAAFAFGGPKLLVQTIEKTTGIRIDEYSEIGLGGLVSLVDAVGGIQICPTERMVDELANLNIKKGCQEADGATALGYARSRHTSGLGDIDRVKHQREVVSAIGSKIASPWSVLNPIRYWKLNHALPESFAFGEGAGPVRALQWASAMTKVDGKDGLTCVVPISDLAVNLDPVRSKELFRRIIEDDTENLGKRLCSPTGLPR